MTHAKPVFLHNIGQLLTLRSAEAGPRRRSHLSDLGIIEDAAVLCAGGRIVSVGSCKDALRDPWLRKNQKKLHAVDCAGRVVMPGFVDSHTHPVFAGPRLVDFEKRIAGASYEEIAEAGGGIRSSLDGVRQSTAGALQRKLQDVFRAMQQHGTTTVEAKSGYGLSLESELKSLRAIRVAGNRWSGTVMATFLGAHTVPPEFRDRRQSYVDLLCREMIPAVASKKLARFVDVFCDRGAFDVNETEQIFRTAQRYGLRVRAHMGQLSETRLASILQYQPVSLDHMDFVNESDLPALAQSGSIVTLVPGANYFLGLSRYANAQRFISANIPVALATDFNPGSSPTLSMPMTLSLACTHLKMSPAQAIASSTINGAWALGLADRKGSIEPGKDADVSIVDIRDYREVAYWFGTNLCWLTMANGVVSQMSRC